MELDLTSRKFQLFMEKKSMLISSFQLNISLSHHTFPAEQIFFD